MHYIRKNLDVNSSVSFDYPTEPNLSRNYLYQLFSEFLHLIICRKSADREAQVFDEWTTFLYSKLIALNYHQGKEKESPVLTYNLSPSKRWSLGQWKQYVATRK